MVAIEVKFKCTAIRCIYSSDNFKIYSVDVNRQEYPQIKFTKYGNATIKGDIHELTTGMTYDVVAEEEYSDQRGFGYNVKTIKNDKPIAELDMDIFLSEVATPRQATILLTVFPDIVDRVMNNNLEDVYDSIDRKYLKGVGKKTFEKIKSKIIMNYCLIEMLNEFGGILSFTMVKKLYAEYTSVQSIREKMKKDPYQCLTKVSGIGFKTADQLLLDMEEESRNRVNKGENAIVEFEEDLRSSAQRCLACITYLLKENEANGHTKMSIATLKEQCDKLVPACCHHFVLAIKDNPTFFLDKELREIARKKTRDTEVYIANRLFDGLKEGKDNIWEIDIEKYRQCKNGIMLSDEQVSSIVEMCCNSIIILKGNAGTGKSQTIEAIISYLDDNNKTYNIFAPTGRASKVAAKYTGRDAKTIHRGLGFRPPNEWMFRLDNKLIIDVLIIDESSMADIFLFKKTLDAIDFKLTKLVVVGDNAQLPSVSCGNLLHDLIESNVIPTITLTKVFRYSEGGLMKVATDIRESRRYLPAHVDGRKVFGANNDYIFIQSDTQNISNKVIEVYKQLLKKGYTVDDIMVLSAQNKGEQGTVTLNNNLQKIANVNSLIPQPYEFKIGDTQFFEGDLVIQTKNNYRAKKYSKNKMLFDKSYDYDDVYEEDEDDNGDHIFSIKEKKQQESVEAFIANGEIGKIISIGSNNVVIDFSGEKVVYTRIEMQNVLLGYSLSVHKAQGGSARIVIYISPISHSFFMTSNLLYVALTRTEERCIHIGDAPTINNAIKKKDNLVRETFLRRLLVGLKHNIKIG